LPLIKILKPNPQGSAFKVARTSMERTSPKRIRIDGCNAVVLEQNKFMSSSFFQKGLQRLQKELKLVSRKKKSIAEGLHKELKLVSRKLQIGKKSSAEGFLKDACNAPTLWHTEA